jgi:hypothetical protein
MFLHATVERLRRLRVEVMRQVCAGDEQWAPAGERAHDGVSERVDRPAVLKTDERRHDGQFRMHSSQEGQLHLERMLPPVGRRQGLNDGRLGECAGTRLIDPRQTQRRIKRAVRPEGDPFEPNEMRRPDQHRDVEVFARRGLVGIRRDRAGEHQASMRRDDRLQRPGRTVGCGAEVRIDIASQGPRDSRIPGSRNCRRPDGHIDESNNC